jgi:hypothetical protein
MGSKAMVVKSGTSADAAAKAAADTSLGAPIARTGSDEARTYEEWKAAAMAEDERTGAARWRRLDESSRYDYKVIRQRLEEVRRIRASGDPHQVLY